MIALGLIGLIRIPKQRAVLRAVMSLMLAVGVTITGLYLAWGMLVMSIGS